MKSKSRKRYMTLLETLIAFTLLSILLVFAFGFFRELSGLTRLTNQEQKQSFQKRYVESRLAFIFERVVNENEDKKRDFFFYTHPPQRDAFLGTSLILTYDNGVRRDPSFSGDILGRLYVNPEFQLRLATWPLKVDDPHVKMQEEVLLENVADIKFKFYSPPAKIAHMRDIQTGTQIQPDKKTPAKNDWLPEWAYTYNQLPGIVKIEIAVAKDPNDLSSLNFGNLDEKKVEKITYSFVIPSSKNPVQYPSPPEEPAP